ncbi:MAG: LysR family transcriptional regulator [Spirosomataceae bacterium]
MKIDTKQLVYFVAVAEERHFSRAAEKLYISQPALSQQIKHLEENLGVELFSKQQRAQNRRVELTDAGHLLWTESKKILAQLAQLEEDVKQIAQSRKVIRLGVYKMLMKERTIELLHILSSFLTDVDLRIMEFPTFQEVQSAAMKEQIDIGISILPLRFGELEGLALVHGHLELIVSSNHRLAQSETIETVDLLGEKWIEIEKASHPIYTEIEEFCTQKGIDRRAKSFQEVSSLDLLCNMVELEMGIAFVPSFYDTSRQHKVVRKKLDNLAESLTISQAIIYKKTHDFPSKEAILDVLKKREKDKEFPT